MNAVRGAPGRERGSGDVTEKRKSRAYVEIMSVVLIFIKVFSCCITRVFMLNILRMLLFVVIFLGMIS